jgi:hypothetical protein
MRLRRRSVAALPASAVLAVLSGCALGAEETGRSPGPQPTTTAGAQPIERARPAQDAVERYRAGIVRALTADARCVARACTTLPALRRRADALADAVRPLDQALAVPTMEAKQTRATTSALRFSVMQLRTCIELSSAKHAGTAMLEECRGPVADFHRAVADLRTTFAAGSR